MLHQLYLWIKFSLAEFGLLEPMFLGVLALWLAGVLRIYGRWDNRFENTGLQLRSLVIITFGAWWLVMVCQSAGQDIILNDERQHVEYEPQKFETLLKHCVEEVPSDDSVSLWFPSWPMLRFTRAEYVLYPRSIWIAPEKAIYHLLYHWEPEHLKRLTENRYIYQNIVFDKVFGFAPDEALYKARRDD